MISMGDPAGAVAPLRECIRLQPDDGRVHCNLGIALDKSGDRVGAEVSFREALRLEPKNASTRNNLVICLAKTGRHHDAARHARRVLALEPAYKQRAALEEVIAAVGDAAVPAPPSPAACAHCGLPPHGRPMRCTGCGAAWYCDRPCQRAGWRAHKKPCRRAAKAAGGVSALSGSAAAGAQ